MKPIDLVLSKLGGVKPQGNRAWMAKCPGHDDRQASLSVKEGDDGKVLLNCHANCDPRDVVAEMELGWEDLFPDRDQTGNDVVARYPYHDEAGKLLYEVVRLAPKSFRQRQPQPGGGWKWNMDGARRVLYHLPAILKGPKDRLVCVCYAPDTEVLTPTGWVAMPELAPDAEVAQWSPTESISFVRPSARQRFKFSGQLIHLKARWCDLLVTPDHRQPTKWAKTAMRVVRAEEITRARLLPVAGVGFGSGGPTEEQARLLTAWIADGVDEKRGSKVSWNLKKDRKKARLRELLSANGVTWTEHSPPSTPGWTGFRMLRADVAHILKFADRKMWPWAALKWAPASRSAILDEIGNWDGDSSSAVARRYFTSDSQSADVISAMSVITGWGVICRVDRRPERERTRDQFVLNLKRRRWRILSASPGRVEYDGDVFCLTVDTGFLVVRRNGKVTISGNCEGEKDCDNLERIGMLATTNVGGAGKWRDDYTAALRGRGVVIFPDNDQPGVAHAATVAKALTGVAAWVKVVELPDLPPKGDVSDWIAAGGTREKLEKLVAAAPGKIPASFKPAASRLAGERAARIAAGKQVLTFGLPYLDQAMSGITRQDVILYGASSGMGKTQLATITAMANAQRGKRVFYFALEAEDREIERRIKYQAIAEMYYSEGPRKPIRYQDWAIGALESVLGRYEDEADAKMDSTLANLKTFYREDSFTSSDFQNQFQAIQDEADLVVLDHFHYVGADNERDDELKSAGKLAKLIHKCAMGAHVPVIVVAHLRKKDRTQESIVPNLEDFSGCKDIGNVATKAVVIAPAFGLSSADSHKWGTYVAAAKNRPEMSVCRYVALSMFDIRKNCYDREYKIGRVVTGDKGKKTFKILEGPEIPFWADQDGQGQGNLRW